MSVELASDYTQLAMHALAHVRLPEPGSLFDAAYVAWAREHLDPAAVAPVVRDAELIERSAVDALQWAPELFDSVEQLLASADIDTLGPADVSGGSALERWRSESPAPELLRVAMCLAAEAYTWPREACAERLARLRHAFEAAAALHPALEGARVELVWALGARGRAYPTRILVGVPDDWTGLAPETPVVLALHEAATRASGGDYVSAEWGALRDVARRMRGADRALRDAHRAWLARLSLGALCETASARGLCDPATSRLIAKTPDERAERLAAA